MNKRLVFIFVFSILLLLCSFEVHAQINLNKAHFPYIISRHNWPMDTDEDVWFKPSPYSELLKSKHISAIHVAVSPKHSEFGFDYYFNENGLLDSIVIISYDYETSEKFTYGYCFHYLYTLEIDYVEGFENVISSGVEAKKNYESLPVVTEDTSLVSLERYAHGANVFLHNKSGQTLSQLSYVYYDGDTTISSLQNFEWNRNKILTKATEIEFNPEPFIQVVYRCTLNEDNLPDTIFHYNDTIVFTYEYSKNYFQWSPCNYKGKRVIEDFVAQIEKYSIPKDSLTTKKVKHLWFIGNYITKAVIEGDTCWFANDYLILAKNDHEAFYYQKDSLVSYSKGGNNPTENESTILKRAKEKMNSVYLEIKRIQPLFGIRVSLIGKESEILSISANIISLNIRIEESEIELLRKLELNNLNCSINGYNFMPIVPHCDLIEWHVASEQITDKEMKYLQMESLTKAYFVNIEVKNSKGESRRLDFSLRIIRN